MYRFTLKLYITFFFLFYVKINVTSNLKFNHIQKEQSGGLGSYQQPLWCQILLIPFLQLQKNGIKCTNSSPIIITFRYFFLFSFFFLMIRGNSGESATAHVVIVIHTTTLEKRKEKTN